jgi:alpha-N-acetylglucosaminidase
MQARPTFDSSSRWANTRLNYEAVDLMPAWDEMMKAAPASKNSDGFQYDLVDIARQVLVNYASVLQQQFAKAYKEKNIENFQLYKDQFIELINDVDELLATRKDFLLGPWVASARKCGKTSNEKDLYEFNAKDIITLWGDQNCPLNEYACRQWSGLLTDFYKPRWEQFFNITVAAMKEGKEMDKDAFIKSIRQWEWQWVKQRKDYPVAAKGNPVAVAGKMFNKYRQLLMPEIKNK